MERRSFLKMFSGALAALPLFKFLSKSKPLAEDQIKRFVDPNMSPGRIDMLNSKHWAPFKVEDDGVLSLHGQTAFSDYGPAGGLSSGVFTRYRVVDGELTTQKLTYPEILENDGGRHV